ncbi:MAG: uracil-DNA glycosylase family protein [Chloroflexota bacterium]
MQSRQVQMDDLAKDLANLAESPLYEYRQKNGYLPVIGEGSLDADVVFIGEAPGAKEAESGRPFVGASGKVLDELLASIDLERSNVFITNIVKDRPPKNRDPKSDEIALYTPFLIRQLEIIQPKVIATLGRFSMEFILKQFGMEEVGQKISQLHGKTLSTDTSFGPITVLPLYHPAVALYNRSQRASLDEGFRQLVPFVQAKQSAKQTIPTAQTKTVHSTSTMSKSMPNLIVKDIERIVLDVPFTPRCQEWNAREIWQWRVSEVIRITTDVPDLVGYGETLLHYTWGRVPDEAIERVKGKNPVEFLGDDSLGAGLQMALYDLVGKALNVPAYRLFNLPKVRDWCPISWWNIDFPPDEFALEAKDAVAHGYTDYKIKARPWWDIYEQVEAISAVTPEHFRLDLDWNQMLINAGNAAPVLTALDKYERVAIYESPIFQRDIEGHRQLRQKTSRPLALHFDNPPFPTVIREEMCDGFVVGGGVANILRQGALAATFDKPFWLQLVGSGLTTALSIQLGAVLPMAQWPSVNCLNIYQDDLLMEAINIQGGYAEVPDKPGLGIDIDETALSRYKMEPPHSLPQPQLLLSVVWPGNRVRHYASLKQVWDDGHMGNIPAQERGVKMIVRPNDDTPEWGNLYAKAKTSPVQDTSL